MKEKIRVRLSSDAAGSISITPVVVEDMLLSEFAEHVVAVCGKDAARIAEVLRHGSLVSGGSRLRWEGWDSDPAEIADLLTQFPDPDPSRPFTADGCVLAVLSAGAQQIAIPRQAGEKRRLFQRRSFWQHLLELGPTAQYSGYSYRHKADLYRVPVSPDIQARLASASRLLTYSTLAQQINTLPLRAVDLYVRR